MSSLCSVCCSRLFSLSFLIFSLSSLCSHHSSFFLILSSSLFFSSFSIRDVVALLISLYRVGTRWTSSVFLPFRSFTTHLSYTIPHVCIHHIHSCTILSHLFQRYLSYSLVS